MSKWYPRNHNLRIDETFRHHHKGCGQLVAEGLMNCYAVTEEAQPPKWAQWTYGGLLDTKPYGFRDNLDNHGVISEPDEKGWRLIDMNVRCWEKVPGKKLPWVITLALRDNPDGVTGTIYVPRIAKGEEELLLGYSHHETIYDGQVRTDAFGPDGSEGWVNCQPVAVYVKDKKFQVRKI